MKKNSRVLLLFLAGIYAISSTPFAQAAQGAVDDQEYAPAVFSTGQVKELKDQFVFWLGKHYRCLYGGKCTRAEKAQVTAEWKRWGKRVGIGTALALMAYFGPKAVSRAGEDMAARRKAAIDNARRDILNTIDPFIQAVELDDDARRQIDRRYGIVITPEKTEAIQREKLKVLMQTEQLRDIVRKAVEGGMEGVLSRELSAAEQADAQAEIAQINLTARVMSPMADDEQDAFMQQYARDLKKKEVQERVDALMQVLMSRVPEIELKLPMGYGFSVKPGSGVSSSPEGESAVSSAVVTVPGPRMQAPSGFGMQQSGFGAGLGQQPGAFGGVGGFGAGRSSIGGTFVPGSLRR